jgi:hypothetical protein
VNSIKPDSTYNDHLASWYRPAHIKISDRNFTANSFDKDNNNFTSKAIVPDGYLSPSMASEMTGMTTDALGTAFRRGAIEAITVKHRNYYLITSITDYINKPRVISYNKRQNGIV